MMPKRDAEYMADQRQKILAATLNCITRTGIKKLTMQTIADEAGVSVGTLYVHFKDREALFAAFFEDLTSEISRFLRDPEVDAIEVSVIPPIASMDRGRTIQFLHFVSEIIALPPDHRIAGDYSKALEVANSIVVAQLSESAEKGERTLKCSVDSITIAFQCAVLGAAILANVHAELTPQEIRASIKDVFDAVAS